MGPPDYVLLLMPLNLRRGYLGLARADVAARSRDRPLLYVKIPGNYRIGTTYFVTPGVCCKFSFEEDESLFFDLFPKISKEEEEGI